jgi:hypothetical protein
MSDHVDNTTIQDFQHISSNQGKMRRHVSIATIVDQLANGIAAYR